MMRDAIAPERASRLVHVLFIVQLVSISAMEMSGPFWPVHLKMLATSGFEFGFSAVAVYVGPMLGMMLTSARWGRVGDRTGHKLMMIRALLALALTQAALAYADSVWTVLALRFIQGTCAGYIAPAQAYGVAIVAPARRARLFAYLQVSTNLGSIAGALAGGVILDHATFFWINIAAALLCTGCALAVALVVPDARAPQPASPERHVAPADPSARSRFWTASPIAGLLAVMGVLLMSRTMTQTPFSLYVDTTFHVGNWAAGLCYGLMSFGFAASASLWARYFEEKAPHEVLQRMTFIAVGCASLTLAAGTTRDVRVFAALYFAWGVLLAATTPVMMSLISHVASGRGQGYLLGVAQSTTQSSSIAGIALGGWLSHAVGFQYTYFFVSAAYAVAVAVIVGVSRERRLAAQSPASPGQ